MLPALCSRSFANYLFYNEVQWSVTLDCDLGVARPWSLLGHHSGSSLCGLLSRCPVDTENGEVSSSWIQGSVHIHSSRSSVPLFASFRSLWYFLFDLSSSSIKLSDVYFSLSDLSVCGAHSVGRRAHSDLSPSAVCIPRFPSCLPSGAAFMVRRPVVEMRFPGLARVRCSSRLSPSRPSPLWSLRSCPHTRCSGASSV